MDAFYDILKFFYDIWKIRWRKLFYNSNKKVVQKFCNFLLRSSLRRVYHVNKTDHALERWLLSLELS